MKYTVILERESDGGFVASVPMLPGCVSQGDTKEEAMANIKEAMKLYIEGLAAGDPVPEEDSRVCRAANRHSINETARGSFRE